MRTQPRAMIHSAAVSNEEYAQGWQTVVDARSELEALERARQEQEEDRDRQGRCGLGGRAAAPQQKFHGDRGIVASADTRERVRTAAGPGGWRGGVPPPNA